MTYAGPSAVRDIIADAGGKIVGRTRLQKCACGLELTGLGFGFQFSYRHFGPYSEELQIACNDADALGLIEEQRKTANWGGRYSVFVAHDFDAHHGSSKLRELRSELLQVMNSCDPVVLELAVTAAFLAVDDVDNPWHVVAERKADKASEEAMSAAKLLYRKVMAIKTPRSLPPIV